MSTCATCKHYSGSNCSKLNDYLSLTSDNDNIRIFCKIIVPPDFSCKYHEARWVNDSFAFETQCNANGYTVKIPESRLQAARIALNNLLLEKNYQICDAVAHRAILTIAAKLLGVKEAI